jgi:hypothetical protein
MLARNRSLFIAAVLLGASGARAQDAPSPIATDRPAYAFSTGVVANLTGGASLGVPGSDRTTQWIEAFAFGRTIGSSKWSAYGEMGATDNDLPATDVAGYAGGGIAALASNDVQIDLWFDRGLTDGAADWLYGLGVSARFGKVQ